MDILGVFIYPQLECCNGYLFELFGMSICEEYSFKWSYWVMCILHCNGYPVPGMVPET